MIYTAPCPMFWMRSYPLRGQVWGGWALDFESFWALWNGIEPIGECHLGPKNLPLTSIYLIVSPSFLLSRRLYYCPLPPLSFSLWLFHPLSYPLSLFPSLTFPLSLPSILLSPSVSSLHYSFPLCVFPFVSSLSVSSLQCPVTYYFSPSLSLSPLYLFPLSLLSLSHPSNVLYPTIFPSTVSYPSISFLHCPFPHCLFPLYLSFLCCLFLHCLFPLYLFLTLSLPHCLFPLYLFPPLSLPPLSLSLLSLPRLSLLLLSLPSPLSLPPSE